MNDVQILSTAQREEWLSVLRDVGDYDFYHLPEYHELHEGRGEGEGVLIVYRKGGKVIALPLLLRFVSESAGLRECGRWMDATSVYGYAGPIANALARSDGKFLSRYHRVLGVFAAEHTLSVAAFPRLNPLLENHPCRLGSGK